MLVAVEGLDQSGKATQAQHLRDRLRASGYKSRVASFPDYGTFLGEEIARSLQGERDYGPEAMQLLYVANRFERKADIDRWHAAGLIVLFDRYIASGVAYGEAQGLDPDWLTLLQVSLPQPELTILLDIAPETAVARKTVGRDRYERDLDLLTRVRQSYLRQAEQPHWVRIDAQQAPDVVAAEMAAAIEPRLPELR
jgi:dTMP kinase